MSTKKSTKNHQKSPLLSSDDSKTVFEHVNPCQKSKALASVQSQSKSYKNNNNKHKATDFNYENHEKPSRNVIINSVTEKTTRNVTINTTHDYLDTEEPPINRFKTKAKNPNKSTLSLHIEEYEKSIQSPKSQNQNSSGFSPLEPLRHIGKEPAAAETTPFKSSQKLLNLNRSDGDKNGRQIPRVRLSSKVDEFSIAGDDRDQRSDGETTITLSKSEERYRQFMRESDVEANEKLAIQKGWCTDDGIPWCRKQMPKDEAALLKQGVVDRTCSRSTYFSLGSKRDKYSNGYPKFFDEVELLKEGLVDKQGNHAHHRNSPAKCDNKSQKGKIMLSNGPINIAELNSRGLVDQNGNIHYGIPSLTAKENTKKKHSKKDKERKEKKKKEESEIPRVQICESIESYSIVKTPTFSDSQQPPSETRVSYSPSREISISGSSTTNKKSRKCRKPKEIESSITTATSLSSSSSTKIDGTYGTIQGGAGHGKDGATIAYTVTNDGRNYQLDTNDGHHLHLEFNKKHAYLILD